MAKKHQALPRFGIDDTSQSVLDSIESFFDRGWTDGLPVIPPTESAVQKMLSATDRDPTESLGAVPPRLGEATVEAVAANAVMAGCKPEYMPVLLAAVEAMLEERLNLNGIQATTNAAAPLCIISGPIVEDIGINTSTNVFGHGHRSNATIGRAIRLILTVIGGGYPETGDKSPLGMPGKFSYCIGESLTTPWQPLHKDQNVDSVNGVTIIGVDAPRAYTTSIDPVEFLKSTAKQITQLTHNVHFGGQILLVVNPLIATELGKAAWSIEDIQYFIYEKARVRLEDEFKAPEVGFGVVNPDNKNRWPYWLNVPGEGVMVPAIRKPEDLLITVAGGTQLPWSALCGGWGFFGGWSVSKPIDSPGSTNP